MLKQRIITGAGLSIAVLLVLWLSGYPAVTKGVSVFLSVMAAWELCRAGGYTKNRAFALGCVAAAILFALCSNAFFAGPLLLAALLGAGYLMKHFRELDRVPEGIILVVSVVCAAFYGLLTALRQQEKGVLLLAMVILLPMITDIGAFIFGKCFGKHKLAPVISPKKTWEGSVGGTACTVALLSLVAWVLERNGLVQVRMSYLMVYLAVASVIAQLGDLIFSTIKRIAGIKDYGNLLPGHGGILDRFDSLVFVIPFTVFVNEFCGPLLASV